MVRYTHWAGLAVAFGVSCASGKATSPNKPNVLVIMTDDQDLLLNSLSVQPNIRSLFGDQGLTFENYYCTVSWCCPSRVSYLTGKAAHNTNVTSTKRPYGGWTKFQDQGLNDNYLPVWLQEAGIDTYYVGKLMNGFSVANFGDPTPPAGWTNSSFLVDPFTYSYYDSHWTNKVNAQHKDTDIDEFDGTHTSTVTQTKGLDMIEQAAKSGNQWYIQIAPVAPHEQLAGAGAPPIPDGYDKPEYNLQIPQTPNFNPDQPSGASWVYDLPQLNSDDLDTAQSIYHGRMANLAYIDDIVAGFVSKLKDLNQLDNTYIIYTTDNGFHIGQHRLPAGKRCPYEEDVNIPFFIRGPDVPQGKTTSYVTSHTDMAPTILSMMGVNLRPDFDGKPIPYRSSDLASASNAELVNVEFWDGGNAPMGVKGGVYYNNTYKALRMISDGNTFLYTAWCTGENEFYDMTSDPSQMNNRLAKHPQGKANKYYNRDEEYLFTRLNALLMVTKSCQRDACRDPWGVIFPRGPVDSLQAAMDSRYDDFFASQPQISYSSCEAGYILSAEGPQDVIPYTANSKNIGRRIRAV